VYRHQNQPLLQAITVPEVLGESTLEHTYGQKSPAESTSVHHEASTVHMEMKREANSQNDDMDTQTSYSKHTWRRGRKHTRKKVGEQLEIISASSTERMSSVPISAPTRRMISVTAGATER